MVNSKAWAWANNDTNVGELYRAQENLQKKLTEQNKLFILTDFKTLKGQMGDSAFESQVLDLLTVEPEILEVLKICKMLQAMHAQRAAS